MNRLLRGLCAAAALWTAACGGGSIVPPPPPVGKYNLASLKGQYAFVTNGEVITSLSTATPLARTGSFIADGLGGITGGLEDVNAAGRYSPALQINGGSYTVNADGRGTLTLNVVSAGITSPINFGMVLTSTSDGLLIDETSSNNQASTGSGNFVLQRGAPFTVGSASGTYVFDFSGFDVSSFPDSIVGKFNVSGGVVSAGVQDENDSFSSALPPTPTPVSFTGTLTADTLEPPADLSTFGRGIASLNGIQYVFYIVDSSRIRFLSGSNGGSEMLTGDAALQNNPPANLSGGFAFIVAGSSASSGVTRVGRFTANGTGLTNVTNVVYDTNNAGSFTKSGGTASTISNASVTMDAAHPGRGVLTFTDSNFAFPLTFVFYLSSATSGVVQEDSQSSGVAVDVADGSIAAQFGGPFSGTNITGTYALNWSGLSLQQGPAGIIDEEDLLAQTTVTSLALSGTSDIFQFTAGQPQTGLAVGGSITFNGGDGTGGDGNRTNMSVIYNKSSGATVNCVVYFATPQLAFFANSNNQGTTRIIAGVLETQQ
jgi:hypothetical protein